MASQTVRTFTRVVGGEETLAKYRLVQRESATSSDVIFMDATATHVPFGVTQAADNSSYAVGSEVSIQDFKAGGTQKVTAAGAIVDGSYIYAAAAGRVQALPAAAGTYLRVGTAFEAASGAGSIFEALLDPSGTTETVTGS